MNESGSIRKKISAKNHMKQILTRNQENRTKKKYTFVQNSIYVSYIFFNWEKVIQILIFQRRSLFYHKRAVKKSRIKKKLKMLIFRLVMVENRVAPTCKYVSQTLINVILQKKYNKFFVWIFFKMIIIVKCIRMLNKCEWKNKKKVNIF